jgi:hypothetical protein
MNLIKPPKIAGSFKPAKVSVPKMPATPRALVKAPTSLGVKTHNALPVPPISKLKSTPSVHLPWLGNKQGLPRPPGAGKQHKLAQVNSTGYPAIKWDL